MSCCAWGALSPSSLSVTTAVDREIKQRTIQHQLPFLLLQCYKRTIHIWPSLWLQYLGQSTGTLSENTTLSAALTWISHHLGWCKNKIGRVVCVYLYTSVYVIRSMYISEAFMCACCSGLCRAFTKVDSLLSKVLWEISHLTRQNFFFFKFSCHIANWWTTTHSTDVQISCYHFCCLNWATG